jgi:hypothetical protein
MLSSTLGAARICDGFVDAIEDEFFDCLGEFSVLDDGLDGDGNELE